MTDTNTDTNTDLYDDPTTPEYKEQDRSYSALGKRMEREDPMWAAHMTKVRKLRAAGK